MTYQPKRTWPYWLLLVIGLSILCGACEKRTEPDLRHFASIRSVHSFHDYKTFTENNQ